MTDGERGVPSPDMVEIEEADNWGMIRQLTDDIAYMNSLIKGGNNAVLLAVGEGPYEVFDWPSRSELRKKPGSSDEYALIINPYDDEGRDMLSNISLTIDYGKGSMSASRRDEDYKYGMPLNRLDIPNTLERSLTTMIPRLKKKLAAQIILNRSDIEREEAKRKTEEAVEIADYLLSGIDWVREPDRQSASDKPEEKLIAEVRSRTWPGAVEGETISLTQARRGKTSIKSRTFLDIILRKPIAVEEQWDENDLTFYRLNRDAKNVFNFYRYGHVEPTEEQVEHILDDMSIHPEDKLLEVLKSLDEQ